VAADRDGPVPGSHGLRDLRRERLVNRGQTLLQRPRLEGEGGQPVAGEPAVRQRGTVEEERGDQPAIAHGVPPSKAASTALLRESKMRVSGRRTSGWAR